MPSVPLLGLPRSWLWTSSCPQDARQVPVSLITGKAPCAPTGAVRPPRLLWLGGLVAREPRRPVGICETVGQASSSSTGRLDERDGALRRPMARLASCGRCRLQDTAATLQETKQERRRAKERWWLERRGGAGWERERGSGEKRKVCAVGELNPDLILGRDES